MSDLALPFLAAIRVEKDCSVDDLLDLAARTMISRGHHVAGFLQHDVAGDGDCCARIELKDVDSGEIHVISQALGREARGCRLDPQALASVAGPLLNRLERAPALLVLNRFGKGEAEGHGFRAVIEAACSQGIPVLTAVREAYVEPWCEFTGELGTLLPPDPDAVLAWAEQIVAAGVIAA